MKKLFIPFVALFLATSLGSCDKIEELADINFDAELSSPTMTLSPPPPPIGKTMGDGGYSFNETSTIDPSSDSDIEKYLNNIKNWDIKSITINFIEVTESGTKLDEGTIIGLEGSGIIANLEFPQGLDIHSGYVYDVPSTFFNKVEDVLNTKKSFIVRVKGGTNNYAQIKLMVTIDVKITANPL